MQAPITNVISRYGAPMGRVEAGRHAGKLVAHRFSLRRVRINQGGYDSGGAYWGIGKPLYWFGDEDGNVSRFIRACDRSDAKAQILAEYPNARFFR